MIPQNTNKSTALTPDEAAASLAFITNLSEKMMPKQEPKAAMDEETDPVEGDKPEEGEGVESTEEGLQEVKNELASLREEIKVALEEDENGEINEQIE